MLKAKGILDSDIATQRQLLKITEVLALLQSNLGVQFRKQLSSILLGMCVLGIIVKFKKNVNVLRL